jgi:DNA-binding NarL/FixJ family response regulator
MGSMSERFSAPRPRVPAGALAALGAERPSCADAAERVRPGGDFLHDQESFAERVRTLTPVQRAILRQIAQGMLNKQIAHDRGVSEATVKAHISAVLAKLGERSRVSAAVRFAVLSEREGREAPLVEA